MIDSQINRISNLHGASHSQKPPTKDFCPNAACRDYRKLQNDRSKTNLKKIGKTPRCVQRYQCKTCGKTLSTTIDIIFYRNHTREDEILEVLALLAEGNRINTLTRVKDIKENIASFLSSIGWRMTSSTRLPNSGNSSKNRTPLCANEISLGCGMLPPPTTPSARYVQTTVTFHFDFAPEIVEESRYGMQTLYSLEHLELANKALGRK